MQKIDSEFHKQEGSGYPDYKNWVPNSMVNGLVAGAAAGASLTLLAVYGHSLQGKYRVAAGTILGTGTALLTAAAGWSIAARNAFSYDGERKLSKQIIEGTAAYVTLPKGGKGLDVGCGSGALTIACAKRNPYGEMIGVDHWGPEYPFSKALCEKNARAEGVSNTSFQPGDAVHLDFPDETFDAVTSNYVYHNIPFKDKQKLLLETLRVLKKGGIFAIHDLMSRSRYGDMGDFCRELKNLGYEMVEMIDTTNGMFMSRREAKRLLLTGSTLLVGRKRAGSGKQYDSGIWKSE